MTTDRPPSRFEYDDDERLFAARAGLRIGDEAPWRGCPSLPLLLAAGEHVLPSDVEAQVEAHLAACAFCRSLVRDVKDAEVPALTTGEHDRILARVQSSAPRVWRRRVIAATWLPAAASLVLVAGLGWYARSMQQRAGALEDTLAPLRRVSVEERQRIATLEGQLAAVQAQLERSEAQPNVPVLDLEPRGARRADDAPRRFHVSAAARFVTLILQLDTASGADGLVAEIRDGQGQLRASIDGLRASDTGVVTVLLPRTAVPNGDASITLARGREGRRVTVAEYRARFDRE